MSKRIFGLFGVGGFAKEVMPIVPHSPQFQSECGDACQAVFVAEDTNEMVGHNINGHLVWSETQFKDANAKKYFNISIGNSNIRERLSREIQEIAKPISLQDPVTSNSGYFEIGKGGILCAFTTISPNVKVGLFFHANIYSYVAHDCSIGDYVTFAPAVKCNGNVIVEDHAYLGTGAIIKNGTNDKPIVIGKGATVGMGAVVTRDVPSGTVVMGNPARKKS